MVRSEVLAGVERRRRWSFEDKVRIIEESFAPGVSVAAVARRNGVAPSLVFGWRDQAKSGHLGGNGTAPMLVPVVMSNAVPGAALPASPSEMPPVPEPAKPPRRRAGLIEIDLGSGRRVKVDRDVDAGALARVLDVLARR